MDLFTFDTSGDHNLLQKDVTTSKRNVLIGETTKSSKLHCKKAKGSSKASGGSDLPPERQQLLAFVREALSSYPTKNEPKTKKKKSTSVFLESDDESNFLRPNFEEIKKNSLKAIEKKESLPQYSARRLAKVKKAERAKTKGSNWYDMPAPEITEELENDLKVLQMRSVLDPKHFYKRNTTKTLPKYFQIGTVQHSAIDYFSERGERKNKKRSLVDELLADAEFQKFNKRKYNEVMEKRRKTGYYKANQKMKKLKKKKK